MGGVPSIEGRVGVDVFRLCRETKTNPDLWVNHWMTFTWDEAWTRKGIVGEEGKARDRVGIEMVHTERMYDCKRLTGPWLREHLFDKYQQGGPGEVYTASFSTDEFSRCWHPWGVPRRLYTLEDEYLNHVLNIAKEYDLDKSRLSVYSAKVRGRGEFHIAIDYNTEAQQGANSAGSS